MIERLILFDMPYSHNLIFSSKETGYKWRRMSGSIIEYQNWNIDRPQKSSLVTFNNKNFIGQSMEIVDDFFYLKGKRYIYCLLGTFQ